MKCEGVIHSDSEILGGTVVFVGTRVPVQSLFDHLEAGDSIDDSLEGFPSVRREQDSSHSANASSSRCSTIFHLLITPMVWFRTSPLAQYRSVGIDSLSSRSASG